MSRHLIDYFSDVLQEGLTLQLRITNLESAVSTVSPVPMDAFLMRLKKAQKRCRQDGYQEKDIRSAIYAVGVWLDLLLCKIWKHNKEGKNPSVLSGFFSPVPDPESFSEILSRLEEQEPDVREVFFIVLFLGFQEFSEGPEEKKGRVRDFLQRERAKWQFQPWVFERLDPSSPPNDLFPGDDDNSDLELEAAEPSIKTPSALRPWMISAGTLLVALTIPIITVVTVSWGRTGIDFNPAIVETAAHLKALTQHIACHSLTYNQRTRKIKGFVGSKPSSVFLKENLSGKNLSLAENAWAIEIIEGLSCNIARSLWPFLSDASDGQNKVEMFLQKNGNVFYEGEKVEVTVVMPSFGGFLYLFYFGSDEQVFHLTHNKHLPFLPHNGGSEVTIGKELLFIEIGAPFGKEMIVAIVSDSSLPIETPELVEGSEEFADRLLDALKNKKRETRVSVGFLPIITKQGIEPVGTTETLPLL